MSIAHNLDAIKSNLPSTVKLVAVSKTKPNSSVQEAYEAGQRIFGENKVQELCDKYESLPKDIEWHMIGHLQTNKVKYIAPFVNLIHGVDSYKLLKEINKQGIKNKRKIPILLQIHIAQEESKFGFDKDELLSVLNSTEYKTMENIEVFGLMGMATFTENQGQISEEFASLQSLFKEIKAEYFSQEVNFKEISMGMSGDYELAIQKGSTMIRVGSAIFGSRNL